LFAETRDHVLSLQAASKLKGRTASRAQRLSVTRAAHLLRRGATPTPHPNKLMLTKPHKNARGDQNRNKPKERSR
jgi:hypothetical protein